VNSIVNDLNRALAQRLLVNVYQTTQDVVYTGYVTAVGETGIALATYDDYGLADGAVFLDLKIVDEVEFASDDLDNMAFRIQTAQVEHFNQVGGQTHLEESVDRFFRKKDDVFSFDWFKLKHKFFWQLFAQGLKKAAEVSTA